MAREKPIKGALVEKVIFTQKRITALTPAPPNPEGKVPRLYLWDLKTPGLGLYITPAGVKTFFYRRKIAGRSERYIIGQFPDFTVDQARNEAAAFRSKIAHGIDPRGPAKGDELTLKGLFDEFVERHVAPYRRPATLEAYKWQFKAYLTRWKSRRLSSIGRKDCQEIHAKIGREHGKYSANRTLALLRAMYSKAAAWGLYEGTNPAAGAVRFAEQSRERFLQAAEIPAFFRALAAEPNVTAADCILMCLLTGGRRSNVQSMQWADVDLDAKVWKIPMTKSGEPQTVPLVPAAVEVLKRRQGKSGPWVFPGKGKAKPITSLRFTLKHVCEAAGLEDLRLHDLRRSLGSWQASTGASLLIIGKSLGHRSSEATRIYSRLSIDPVRESMEKAVDALIEASKRPSNVRPLKKAGK